MQTTDGMILKGVGGLYAVRPFSAAPGDGTVLYCRPRGVFSHENVSPMPGDFVRLQPDVERSEAPDDRLSPGPRVDYVMEELLPRRNVLIRPPVANLSHILVVIPAAHPQPDLLTADKLISIAEYCHIEPVIIVNKRDLDEARTGDILDAYRTAGFASFAVSAASGDGVDDLAAHLCALADRGQVIAAVAGASGCGKSTLLGALFPDLHLTTGGLSRKTERGRHTTRQVELFPLSLNGRELVLADTPGFSLLDFTRFNFYPSPALPETFREFLPCLGRCRYTRCTHTKEEDCAVIADVKAGKIAESRHASYCALFEDFRKKPDWKRKQEGLLND